MISEPGISAALSDALIELAGPLPAEERARRLATAVSRACGGAGTEVVFTNDDGGIAATAGSDPGCTHLTALERRLARDGGAGPGLECARSGEAVTIPLVAGPPTDGDGEAPSPFTIWAAAARAQGWALLRAVPLRARDLTVGGLVLLATGGRPLTAAHLAWADALGGVSAAGLLQQRHLDGERLAGEQLAMALRSRIVLEQAKGVLAERGGVDVQVAFDRLRRYARTRRQRLTDAARDVVEGEAADDVLTFTGSPGPPTGRRRSR